MRRDPTEFRERFKNWKETGEYELPRFTKGKEGGYTRLNGNPVSFDEEGNLIDQVTGLKGTMLLPDLNVTTANPKNYRSSYNSDDVIKGFNALTLGGLNNLSPTQWVRRGYDLMNGNLTTDSWFNGNSGIVSNKFLQEHPYYSTLINGIGDGIIGASTVLSARILNQLRPLNLGKHFYYNVNPLGYDNMLKLAKGIIKTVLKGSEPDIENPVWDIPGSFKAGAFEYGVPEDVFRRARIDAWRMHTNLPLKYNTFIPSKRVPGAYTADNDVSRMMIPDVLEDPKITKMLGTDRGVGIDFFNGSGGNVGFVNYDLGRTINGDKLGVLVTDDVWDVLPFSRIDFGKGLGSRLTEHTTTKLLKKILPIKSKIIKKLDNWLYKYDEKDYLNWFDKQPADVLAYVDKSFVMDEFKKQKPILGPVLNHTKKVINNSTTKISDFDRWLRKTLNYKAKNFEVGSLYKGSPFRVINEFPYTRALNIGLMNPTSMYSYWGGFNLQDVLPTLAHDYHIKGILPINLGDNIPSKLAYR